MSLCPPECLSEMYGFVCFRDLKIENLLLDEDNNIKLIGMTSLSFFFKDYPLSVVLLIINFGNCPCSEFAPKSRFPYYPVYF